MHKKLFILFAAGLLSCAAFTNAYASQHQQEFGHAVVCGDFNSDGYDDLAVGDPLSDETGVECGSVAVFYGSALGLSDEAEEVWVQDGAVFPNGKLEDGDDFGYALAAGNFDGLGPCDLAVGNPFDVEEGSLGGTVNVLYGAYPAGLSDELDQLLVHP